MSRRAPPNAAAERAAQNQQTIKTLLKLEGNKSCADCKKNKHPRWASWNLGVFVCIRCSGIHRGMGTHISRVKSVDLDAWTDEQLQSVLRWGNARANKYWEAKLAEGHMPSESKIENFIRTKYESKRWVMDGPMPDPASLDVEGDDDVPLNLVQQKAKLGAGPSQQVASQSKQPLAPPPKATPQLDLFGDVPEPPARPNTTDAHNARPPPPKGVSPPKQKSAGDSLLGMDFFGNPPAPSARPSSSASTPAGPVGQSRPDLKQSILSLYASTPKTQPPVQHERQASFGGMQSPPAQAGGPFGGLDDAFGNLNFNPPATGDASKQQQQQPQKSDPFATFNAAPAQRSSAAPPQVTTSGSNGGGFFDTGTKPNAVSSLASKPAQKPQASLAPALSSDFGNFDFASSAPPALSKPTSTTTTSASNDLFDFAEPISGPASSHKPSAPKPTPAPPSDYSSAFNLSNPTPAKPSQPQPQPANDIKPLNSNLSQFDDSDAWGSSDAWGTTETAPPPAPKVTPSVPARQPSIAMSTDFSAWGGNASTARQPSMSAGGFGSSSQPAPSVAPDEDFGGWSSAAPEAPAPSKATPQQAPAPPKPASGGFGGGSDDLFSNVWG